MKIPLDIPKRLGYSLFMNNMTCSCGAPKAERARICFKCHAAEYKPTSYIREKCAGEAGPRFFAYLADGRSRTFPTYEAAKQWMAAQ